MMERQNFVTDEPWQDLAGYSRAVRCDDMVYISGITAMSKQGKIVGVGDAYSQAVYIIQQMESVLQEFDATLADVVRTRIYLTDAVHWQAVARAHEQYFSDIRPANTLVVVKELIGQGYLVAIEADAVVGSGVNC